MAPRPDPYDDDDDGPLGDPKKYPKSTPVPPLLFVGIPTLALIFVILAFVLR